MKIIKHNSQNLYTCSIGIMSFTSPNYDDVAKWRDDNAPNQEYYKEIKVLHDKAMQDMYDNNKNNYTGD
tara:strand:+ start:104 stop:310 length:207 start_codon:yes stop_codon:yes gene_type:complete